MFFTFKYPYSYKDIYYVFKNSDWQFSKHFYDSEKLLALIFGEKVEQTQVDDYSNYIFKNNKYREIIGVQLTRTLRKYLESNDEVQVNE